MSRSTMLRTRRKDINIKPNRRLDRKSSRGMIYENEELRLRTININAEVEKGQSDIKKLRRENEQLRREIWFIRNEYEKLENKLLSAENSDRKNSEGSENSTTCSSEEEDSDGSTCTCTATEEESHKNDDKLPNRYNNLSKDFDHLSVVSEEHSGEKSSDERETNNTPQKTNSILGPDQSYPTDKTINEKNPSNFFSVIPAAKPTTPGLIYDKTSPDIYVNEGVSLNSNYSFQSGGNLEQLLQDMDLISKDILDFTTKKSTPLVCPSREHESNPFLFQTPVENNSDVYNKYIQVETNLTPESSPQYTEPYFGNSEQKPYKSEINVVLVPNPMPLIGFEKYKLTQQSNPDLDSERSPQFAHKYSGLKMQNLATSLQTLPRQNSSDFNLNILNETTNTERICQTCQGPFYGAQNSLNCNNCHNFGPLAFYENREIPSPQIVMSNEGNKGKKALPSSLELPSPSFEVHPPEEINSPRIMKENFPDTSTSVTLTTIDDTNLDKTTSSSDDKSSKPQITGSTNELTKTGKVRKHRKLSIHFNGSKKSQDKQNRNANLETPLNSPTPKHLDTPIPQNSPSENPKTSKTNLDQIPETTEKESSQHQQKSPTSERKFSLTSNTSASIDIKKHVKIDGEKQKFEKKHKHDSKKRRKNSSTEKLNKSKIDRLELARSTSMKHDSWLHNRHYDSFNEFTSLSERERTNSLTSESSRNTSRKLSTYSTLNTGGKVPWCGCWGNGCL